MNIPEEFRKKLESVTAKRPATIIAHIMEHGSITSKEIKDIYGYNHPPRAIRDVREQDIPIITFRVKDSDGRTIAAYRFGNFGESKDKISKNAGRTALSKALKKTLIDEFGAKCFIYQETFDPSLLQVDHRIPYEIAGEQGKDPSLYMLLCPSANRAKAWSCEHCANWNVKDPSFCIGCFWTSPENYSHIAGNKERRIVLTFTADEVNDYNNLIKAVGLDHAQAFIKDLIKQALADKANSEE